MLEYWYIERGLLLPVGGELRPRTKTGILEPLRGGIYNFLRSDKQPSPFYLILLGLNHLLWKEDSVTQNNYRKRFYLGEFHLVHPLPCVPVQESLTSEHSSELFTDSFKQFLNGSAVTNESGGHLEPARRNVANSGLDIVGNPFHKVGTTNEKNAKTY